MFKIRHGCLTSLAPVKTKDTSHGIILSEDAPKRRRVRLEKPAVRRTDLRGMASAVPFASCILIGRADSVRAADATNVFFFGLQGSAGHHILKCLGVGIVFVSVFV